MPTLQDVPARGPPSLKDWGRRWLRWIGRTATMGQRSTAAARGHSSCQRLARYRRGQRRRDPWARARCCAECATFSTATGVNSSRPHATTLAARHDSRPGTRVPTEAVESQARTGSARPRAACCTPGSRGSAPSCCSRSLTICIL